MSAGENSKTFDWEMDESVMVIFEIYSKEVKIVSEKYTNELDCATELRI